MDKETIAQLLAISKFPGGELYLAYDKRQKERFAKYGWDFVSDATATAIFESVVRPSTSDFSTAGKGLFVKQVHDDIFHVITFKQGRCEYGLGWGVSLSYVPHKWDEDGCKFHRTLKSARRDLFEYESNLITNDPEARLFPYYEADMNHGTVCFFDDLMRGWEKLQPVIRNWLGTMTTLDGVLKEARFQMDNREWQGPKLVYAFTLARMGQYEQALAVLDELMAQDQSYASPELPKALKKIAKTG